MSSEVKRGEIYWVDWSPGRGSEQIGKRPALIIQNDIGNEFSPTIIVASCSTTIVRKFPFIVHVSAKESGLPKDCAINLAQIFTIDKTRLSKKCGKFSPKKMQEVDEAIKKSLGLNEIST
jgi:mRNA interferase MazF